MVDVVALAVAIPHTVAIDSSDCCAPATVDVADSDAATVAAVVAAAVGQGAECNLVAVAAEGVGEVVGGQTKEVAADSAQVVDDVDPAASGVVVDGCIPVAAAVASVAVAHVVCAAAAVAAAAVVAAAVVAG